MGATKIKGRKFKELKLHCTREVQTTTGSRETIGKRERFAGGEG